jgi:hypothetical protein
MGFLNRLFGRKGSAPAASAEDQARSQQLAGRSTAVSAEDQAATRARMEAEMDGQRQRRAPPAGTA